MRTTIASKLFIGFLFVILLNVLFVVVVSRLGDLYGVARMLGWQNDVKNGLLRVAALHGAQRTQFLILEKLGRREAYDNLLETTRALRAHLDSMDACLGGIHAADSAAAPRAAGQRVRALADSLRVCIHDGLGDMLAAYGRGVDAFSVSRLAPGAEPPAESDSLRTVAVAASDSLLALVRRGEGMVDRLTRLRLADIQARISAAKRLTMLIVAGMSIFALAFGLVFSHAMTRSLRRLKDAAARIARGDFTIDTSGYPDDEIGDLAQAFAAMARDLRETQEALVRAKRLAAIGEIVASVKHAINNPLMIISGNAQLLEMALAGRPEDLARVRTIIEESERISDVTRKLQEIRRPVVEQYGSAGGAMINLDKSAEPGTDASAPRH